MFNSVPLLYLETARDLCILFGAVLLLIFFVIVCIDNQRDRTEKRKYSGSKAVKLLIPVLLGASCILIGAWCGVESTRTEIVYEEIWEIDTVVENKNILQCILTTANGEEYVADIADVTGNITTGEANNRGYAEITTYVHPMIDGSPAVSKINLYINIDI